MTNDALFLDTAYIYALFNTRDQWHEQALEWQRKIALENLFVLTTEFVLTEIGNGLSSLKFRRSAADIIYTLQENAFVKIIPASSELFLQALNLYEQRQDQKLGLDRLHIVCRDERKQFDTSLDHRRPFPSSRFQIIAARINKSETRRCPNGRRYSILRTPVRFARRAD